jgi:hypothetical protein
MHAALIHSMAAWACVPALEFMAADSSTCTMHPSTQDNVISQYTHHTHDNVISQCNHHTHDDFIYMGTEGHPSPLQTCVGTKNTATRSHHGRVRHTCPHGHLSHTPIPHDHAPASRSQSQPPTPCRRPGHPPRICTGKPQVSPSIINGDEGGACVSRQAPPHPHTTMHQSDTAVQAAHVRLPIEQDKLQGLSGEG